MLKVKKKKKISNNHSEGRKLKEMLSAWCSISLHRTAMGKGQAEAVQTRRITAPLRSRKQKDPASIRGFMPWGQGWEQKGSEPKWRKVPQSLG